MPRLWIVFVLVCIAAATGPAYALPDPFGFRSRTEIVELNKKLGGHILDYTSNHGVDRRIYSPALDKMRDIYVYLPPGYDGVKSFPMMLFLHGLGQDEKIFLEVVFKFDDAIRAGTAPPMVIVIPDGSVDGEPKLTRAGSFYINSEAGRFGDYIVNDVWPWAFATFKLRPEREAHCLAGASMGGFGAYNIAFKNKHLAQNIAGIIAPLNLRYGDCYGRYMSNYDPNCFALRKIESRNEIVGRFGVLLIRARRMLDPIVGKDFTTATAFVSRENPYEMLTRLHVRPGEFDMFIGFGKKDEFNIDAEIESFIAECARLGLFPTTILLPEGRHSVKTATALIPALNQWLLARLGPYTPADYVPPTRNVYVKPVMAIRPLSGVTLAGWEFPPVPTLLP